VKTDINSNILKNKNNLQNKLELLFSKYPDMKNNSYPDELFILLGEYLNIFADGLALDNENDRKKLLMLIQDFLFSAQKS
jgi:hypothetical protein